jgi:N-succinyldiaminopimelate aminotransferase
VNPHLSQLQPYPFEKLRRFLADVTPAAHLREIRLSIGEPQHATPDFIKAALSEGLSGLANYPSTAGIPALRQSIAAWIGRRYDIPALDAETQVLPVNGSREALFAFAQTVIDGSQPGALVVCPNPFYQIYEGAALLAGAQPVFINTLPQNNFNLDLQTLSEEQWRRVQLLYVCTPGNPTGKVLSLDDWRELFALSDRYGFVIASDECYSEIYFDEQQKPMGGLEAARKLGRDDYRSLVIFSSLSKRSNVPGMRSGFVAGDKALIQKFLLYRTYHGSAMSPAIQAASIAAWNDEAHVIENRRLYREKFTQVTPVIAEHLGTTMPDAGFYLWASVDKIVDKVAAKYATFDDTEFARELLRQYNVSVLPGSYLARTANGINPGSNFVRIALVVDPAECLEGAQRIADFCRKF